MKPGTSCKNTSGMLNASQIWMKRAALSAESTSRMPPRWLGCWPRCPPAAADAREAGDEVARPAGLDVEPLAVIDDRGDELVHVVGARGVLGQQIEQRLLAALDRVGHGQPRRGLLAARREVREVVAHERDALGVVGRTSPSPTPLFAVHLRAAELLLGDVLARHGLHERRARRGPSSRCPSPSARSPRARDVRRARGAGAHHRRHLRHHAAHVTCSRNRCPSPAKSEIASGCVAARVDARARRVDEPHHRPAPRRAICACG
jgi:hypothetical protein